MKSTVRFIVLLAVLALLVVGPALVSAQAPSLTLWTFVNTHARWFEEMAERYAAEVNPDFTLEVVEIAYADMHDQLLVALQSGGIGAPDIADIEQGRFGGFLRSGDPGLVDLAPWLEEGGYLEQLVATRMALYSYQGAIYGVEHALTPVVYYYRADIWEAAGVDPSTFVTWDDFIAGAKIVVEANPGAVALPVNSDLHQMLLRQRGGDYFDADGNVTIDSELSIDTMNWILAQIDAGIAAQFPETGYGPSDYAAYNEGKLIGVLGADWYSGFLIDNVPDLAGKWKAAALPAWEEGGARTSVLGGTGATIVSTSPNVDLAWDFLKFTMLSVEGNVRRFELTNLFPCFIPAWDDPRLSREDAYFSNQDLGALFAEVGPGAPAQYQSPYRSALNDLNTAAFQDIIDGVRPPEEVFGEIATTIRDEMAADM